MKYLQEQLEKEAMQWMNEATQVANQALCLNAKCGAVIVKDNQIIGAGYNAPPQNKEENRMCDKKFGPGKPNYDKTCCLHAEWRAIINALKDNPTKDSQTIKNIASSLKTLADMPGTDLSANQDVQNLYQTVVESQIADLQKTTLTDDQKNILAQAENLYSQGKYSDALELLMTNN